MNDAILDQFKKFKGFWNGNSRTFVNLMATLGTAGLQQIFSDVIFRCPCQQKATDAIGEDCPTKSRGTSSMPTPNYIPSQDNGVYGLVFLLVPAAMLFFIGFALNPTTWKLFTGYCGRRHARRGCRIYCAVTMPCLIAPTTWVTVALLQGKYLACALSTQPYRCGCTKVYKEKVPSEDLFSTEYNDNIAKSQVTGWIFSGIAFLIGIVLLTIFRCTSPLVYWQREFMSFTKETELEQYKKIAKEEIEKAAEENVKHFISSPRCKMDWEDVTNFHRIKEQDREKCIDCYSSLQEWSKKNLGMGLPHRGLNASTDTLATSLSVGNLTDPRRNEVEMDNMA